MKESLILKRIIYVLAFVLSVLYVFVSIEEKVFKWVVVLLIEFASLYVAKIFLGEKPGEFFDNFGNYKQAPISSIIVLLTLATGVIVVIVTISFILGSIF